jgi:Leucine-rich repeat (LRR) protein
VLIILRFSQLSISDTALFQQNALKPLSKLTTLVIADSKIDQILPGYFSFSEFLSALSIHSSSIASIGEKAFDGLALSELTIYFCDLAQLPSNLGSLPNLRFL